MAPCPWQEVLLLLLGSFQAGIAAGRELVLELLDTPGRVDVLQLARVKRVTRVADINLKFFTRAVRLNLFPQPQVTAVSKYSG